MNWVLSALDGWADLRKIEEGLLSGSASRMRVDGVTEPVKALVIAGVARGWQAPILVISPTGESAQKLHQDLRALWGDPAGNGGQRRVLLLPSLEALLYEDVSPDPELVGDRLTALDALLRGEPAIVVASAPAALQRCVPPDLLRPALFSVEVGAAADRDDLILSLIELGYEREQMVTAPGQFSVRGGVVDVFPSAADWPVRVELLGDQVESLRAFDTATQRSVGDTPSLRLLPARELVLSEEVAAQAAARLERAAADHVARLVSEGKDQEARRLRDRVAEVVEALRQGAYAHGLEYYLPFLYPHCTTVLDYLPSGALLVVDEPARLREGYQEFLADLMEIALARMEHGLLLPTPEPHHLPLDQVEAELERRTLLELCLLERKAGRRPTPRISVSCQQAEAYGGNIERLGADLREWQAAGGQTLIATRQADRLLELLAGAGVPGVTREAADTVPRPGQVVLSERPLTAGFRLPGAGLAALTDVETFGWRKLYRPYRRRLPSAVPIGSLTDLTPGDYVVHINHGIGIYRGLVRRSAEEGAREYLLVEYANEDKLYVPADQFDRVQKYLGGDEEPPAIHRLGGPEWERAKRKAKASARELAAELVRLYAARQQQPGHPFSPDAVWQREMEDGFPYEETPDQALAIEEVKRDMESERPMDRLVCGDVGFGKTEVAIRAAFKAVMDGMQVAVLAPTTVLAQQHATTFSERLAPYPVRIELLSRFRTRKEQLQVVEGLAAGSVDIVIGTHRLLSKDIQFKQLGLVIVDEEQRFGVRHKEKLKQFRATVDVLTLTATPIPRTLHMALSGIRDITLINDPPEGRIPIITRAMERDEGVIREAVMRELDRGGQVYYVHNRVESIAHVAEHVRQLVPHARLAVAHGQMEERELERAMMDFYSGDAQVLVCTTIIENGLDIPNVNTMIVSDSDRLGLAQLYQLRGRVGRSSRQAYAYLMWTPFKRLTEAAEKRIAAIREFSHLGSGFKVARRDLEISGAGNLLGPEQHGFVASVGFELYMQMLQEAVQEVQGEEAPERLQVSVDLPVSAYLPDDYAPDLNQRIELYRRLAAAPDQERVDRLTEEMADRFGRPFPEPVQNLVRLAKLKAQCAGCGVERVTTEGNLATLHLAADRRLTAHLGHILRRALSAETRAWLAMVQHDRVIVSLRKADTAAAFARLEETLSALRELPLEQEARKHQRRNELLTGVPGGNHAASG